MVRKGDTSIGGLIATGTNKPLIYYRQTRLKYTMLQIDKDFPTTNSPISYIGNKQPIIKNTREQILSLPNSMKN